MASSIMRIGEVMVSGGEFEGVVLPLSLLPCPHPWDKLIILLFLFPKHYKVDKASHTFSLGL